MFTQVAIPSMLMLCLEWWTFEIGGILAGLISKIELGAQSIMHLMITILYMVNPIQLTIHVISTEMCLLLLLFLLCTDLC